MTITASLLNAAIAAVCPIDGVAGPFYPPASDYPAFTLYPAGDGTLWRIDFQASATPSQQQAAISVLAAYADPPPVQTATGNQFFFAIKTLKLATPWRAAVMKSADSDQNRVGLLARDTLLTADDPLLARIAANGGTDAGGKRLTQLLFQTRPENQLAAQDATSDRLTRALVTRRGADAGQFLQDLAGAHGQISRTTGLVATPEVRRALATLLISGAQEAGRQLAPSAAR